MFLERIFGNLYGLIWLIVFIMFVAFVFVCIMFKKENNLYREEKIKEYFKEIYKEYNIEENEVGKFEVKKNEIALKTFDSVADCKIFIDVLLLREEKNESVYEIVEVDGYFKVRKKGNERTIRKFDNLEEAKNYIKEKENND